QHSTVKLACWLNPTVLPENGTLRVFSTDAPSASGGLLIGIQNQKPIFSFGNQTVLGTTKLVENEWCHLACTYDLKTHKQCIFLNGDAIGEASAPKAFSGKGTIFLGRSLSKTYFNGLMSDLRIWKVARTPAQIGSNYRQYRETYVLRGPVDGSGVPEHLFGVPAEGGLNLLSRAKAGYEKRLIAYRQKTEAQIAAAALVQSSIDRKAQLIRAKQAELGRTQRETAKNISDKKEEHVTQRQENRNRLQHAQNDKVRKIRNANRAATNSRNDAHTKASKIKGDAHQDAAKMKQKAQANRDAAQDSVHRNTR
ncbi:MAG: LamG-like jellyroll fold domain-containing protein, partial [Bacteroidota bacterium]